MHPQLRRLRRLVIAGVVERVAAEAALVAIAAGVGAGWAGWRPIEIGVTTIAAVALFVVMRIGSAIAANPVNYRYLLRWTDPTARLRIVDRSGERAADDAKASDLAATGFRPLARIERSDGDTEDGTEEGADGHTDAGTDDDAGGLDVYQVDGGRLVATSGDDGEITLISRLDDNRLVVTATSLLPPADGLIAQRLPRGDRDPTLSDAIVVHVEKLLELRRVGREAVPIGTEAVVSLLRTEWEAWDELGPIVGPLVALGPRRRSWLRLEIHVSDELFGHRGDAVPTVSDGDREKVQVRA